MNQETKTNKPSDAEKLQNVLDALDITASKLADRAGYKSKSSIYHVLNGINTISISMAKNICKAYPDVNLLYLTIGKLPVLLRENLATTQSNMLTSISDEELLGSDFKNIPKTLEEIKVLMQEILKKM